jgi:uncharacterized protein YbaR (Trm112 family)
MKLSLSDTVLALLVCPVTKKPLHLATEAEAAEWTATEPFECALVSEDASHAYPIREGFPLIVASEALIRKG